MSSRHATYLCGGDTTPGPRDVDCPHKVHDYPLPVGYVDAAEQAGWRLRHWWTNRRCPMCGVYGWIAPPTETDRASS